MKAIKYLSMALTSLVLLASCMGKEYAPPYIDDATDITPANAISIADLKSNSAYASAISGNSYRQITDDVQLVATVTGNDAAGNLYNEIALQDATGAILVRVGKSALYGDLPVGQKIVLSLKDLYIGGYGQQAQLGNLFEGSVGKIDRFTWPTLYRKTGAVDANYRAKLVEEFDQSKMRDASYITQNAGKLMVIRGVEFSDADGKAVYAGKNDYATGGSVNKSFKGISSSNLVLRTSTYATFANDVLPSGKKDITGIFTRYRNTWQIILLSTADITDAK